MNLRALTLKYLGWCPGVKAAARFVPDRDIPPTRIVMIVAFVGSVSLSSFFVAHRALTIIGFPQRFIGGVGNTNPQLVVVDGQLYIVVEVGTTAGRSWADYYRDQIYLAKLSLDGRLEDKTQILDLGESLFRSMGLLVTKDRRWYLAYNYAKIERSAKTRQGIDLTYSDLFVTSSEDGRRWSEPKVISYTERPPTFSNYNPTLTEMKNGEIFLSFNNGVETMSYSTFTTETGWNPPEGIPIRVRDQSSFLGRDGRINVIGVNHNPMLASEIEGILLTSMGENGSWTEPKHLRQHTANLRGWKPKIFYSCISEGYFLVLESPSYDENVIQVMFTQDMETWRVLTRFIDASDASLAELPDGTLVIVFERAYYEPHRIGEHVGERLVSRGIYISTSSDGVTWMDPKKLEKIKDEETLEIAISWQRTRQRSITSTITSITVTACTILLIYKKIFAICSNPRARDCIRWCGLWVCWAAGEPARRRVQRGQRPRTGRHASHPGG